MVRFHILCGEVSDDLEERINRWIAEMHAKHNPRDICPRPTKFKVLRWSLTHNNDLIYWTAEYSLDESV